MNLLVFGATGPSGMEIVQQALQQRHTVAAFARNPASLNIRSEHLHIVKGDILDAASVAGAMPGMDAVLSALGTKVLKKNTIISDGTRNIIAAMQKCGVRRFVCETSLGVGDSKDQLGGLFKWIVLPLMLRNVFADKEVQERYIMESGLDWVIARPGYLTNGPQTGVYKAWLGKPTEKVARRISRADVADFMLKQITGDAYLKKTPGLSY